MVSIRSRKRTVRVCNDVHQRARLCGQGQVILCRAPADAGIRRGRGADPPAARNPPRSRAIASISVVVTARNAFQLNDVSDETAVFGNSANKEMRGSRWPAGRTQPRYSEDAGITSPKSCTVPSKRLADTAPGEVRSGDQPQDRHGTRP
jgi:hypothetical protein